MGLMNGGFIERECASELCGDRDLVSAFYCRGRWAAAGQREYGAAGTLRISASVRTIYTRISCRRNARDVVQIICSQKRDDARRDAKVTVAEEVGESEREEVTARRSTSLSCLL